VHLGLGLHIVRLIVDFHHARVKAENLPDNDGVRVSIYLPVS
jgi:nitrogen fixation/metabolism regulation signal transduction histidine kinase